MTDRGRPNGQFEALRGQAEARIPPAASLAPEALSPENGQRLFHELQVHQLELELQNEELQRSQEETETARERYFSLFELAPVGYLTLSEQQLVLNLNLTAATLLGKPKNALLEEPFSRFVLAEDADLFYFHQKRCLETGVAQVSELRLRRGASGFFWARLESALGQEVDGTPWFRVVLSDITESRKAQEKILLMNEDLEAFAYCAAHDLRAPLRTMASFAEALEHLDDAAWKATGPDYLQRIRTAARRMGQLLDDLDSLSALDTCELLPEDLDLFPMANQVMEDLHATAPERKLTFTLGGPMQVRGDRRLLRLLLEKLLGNAWRLTAGKPEAVIELRAQPTSSLFVTFTVKDNGVGFPASQARKLFIPFQCLEGPSEVQGSGIGLAQAKRIVHRHEGQIQASGEAGQGATLQFTLPLPPVELP